MIEKILKDIKDEGGQPYEAGGMVRDSLLNLSPKDSDYEVFGLSPSCLLSILEKYGPVDAVGVSFGVLKLRVSGEEFDFTLPRRENKVGQGHKGFLIEADPFMTVKEACSRRDFTINSMLRDPFTKEILDPFKGLLDLQSKTLRATSVHFEEDPLRVLRGMQFAGRFGFEADNLTLLVCRTLRTEYKTLAIERVWEEWKKLSLRALVPSKGLEFLKHTKWATLFPELSDMIGCKQNPIWHPEGDAWIHTGMVCDEAILIAEREKLNEKDRLVLFFASLLHDVGKPGTSRGVYPDITSAGHPEFGEPIAERFLYRIGAPVWLIERVKPLVKQHMVYLNCGTAKAVNKLAVRLEPSNMYELCLLIEADHRGRGSASTGLPEKAQKMLALSQEERVTYKKPKAIIQGRHLIDEGLIPGPTFGPLVKEAYQQQLDKVFSTEEEGVQWLLNRIKKGH